MPQTGLRRGLLQGLPLAAAILPFGLVAGIAAQGRALSFAEATLMSVIVFAGAAQLLVLAAWTHPASILAATLAALVVNLRLALMGPVLAPWLNRMRGWRLWASLFVLTDHNWALSVTRMQEGETDGGFLLGSGLLLWAAWVASSIAGYLLGAVLQPPPGHPLFFAAIAVFVAMLATMWRGGGDILPWAIAAAVAIAVAQILPGSAWHIVAGALAGSLAGALRDERRAGTR
jgi:4-azaleucine resistance transporter AzlC